MLRTACVLTATLALLATSAQAGIKTGLKEGNPNLKSAGPLAIGPGGILFVADPKSAAVFAIDTQDPGGDASKVNLNIQGIDGKVAALLGTTADRILINDLIVNPTSGNVYLSVSRGRGPDATPVLLRIGKSGKISEVSLKNVKFAKATLPNPPADKVTGSGRRARNKRMESITDLAFVDGRLFIAGLSNEEFASKLHSIPFPFKKTDAGVSVEIFHGAHGKLETRSPIRTFVKYDIAGEPHLLAAYTCTPLVKFPVSALKAGKKLMGTTVAELGSGNRPLDMIVYEKGGKKFLLLSNNRRGVMKISTDKLDRKEGITERVSRGGKAGQTYETIENLKGVVQLDRLNKENAVVLIQTESGTNLKTVPLP